MHTLTWYGCLYPSYYQLHAKPPEKEKIKPPTLTQVWNSEEGKALLAINKDLTDERILPGRQTPIVVYNKNRKPVALPKGATALDFAYRLDRSIGEHAVYALVNNRKAPLYRLLDAGDTVEISTSSELQVQDAWLRENHASTQAVRRQIKDSLKRRFLDRRGYELLC